ncbi:MAG: hypothetical protein HUU22_15290 [Phycisphaerae bacterium]|nr:hypothetical protein [Phycisphaerae bacterium]NUQ47388.1 hypothetical protein [Phycisphaerae bacterium]
MLVEHTYEIVFDREQVPEPIVWGLAHECREAMFNIDFLSVSKHEALMRISVVGEAETVNRGEAFLKRTGADVKLVAAVPFRGEIPNVPARTRMVPPDPAQAIHRKLWLTIVGPLRRQPLFWVLSRRFDVTYKLMQSTVGEPVTIICLHMWGQPQEVEGAVQFLRDQGVDVEFGELPARPE